MLTSLQAIANKAERDKQHRFSNLYSMLDEDYIFSSWEFLNKKAATGVDRVSAADYGKNLQQNIEDLVERLKKKQYRAKQVRRQYIPKSNGKVRPLGINAIEDKLLQKAVARILEAIFEQDFLPSSYGYRPNVGPQDAVRDLSYNLQMGKYGYIVEADIKSYFDKILHPELVKMLEQRIDDKPFLRLIEKWLKAGVLDTDGKVIDPITGVPQGGIVSPVLSNVYLHYVLDSWFERTVKKHCRGEAQLWRFADDFVCAFQFPDDAQRFYKVLGMRLEKFGLELAREKTKIISFSRFRQQEKTSFEFLGFQYRWGTSRSGKFLLKRKTSRKKLNNSIANFAAWIKENRGMRMKELFKKVNAKLRGYYNYYGVIGNFSRLRLFFIHIRRLLKKWLNRRSQRVSYNWNGLDELLKHFRIERPRITEIPKLALFAT